MKVCGNAGFKSAVMMCMLVFALLAAPPAFAQEDRGDGTLDTEAPITIDFVKKDIHTVMHFIALRSGLQIIVDSSVDVNLTVMFRNVIPREAVRSICQANKLDMVVDGDVIIVRARVQEVTLANVTRARPAEEEDASRPRRFNVRFESHALVQAIMEVAGETDTQVSVPSVMPEEPRDAEEEERVVETILEVQRRQVSLYMRDATPEMILRRLAALGNMRFNVATTTDADGNEVPIYEFTYQIRRRPSVPGEGDVLDEADIQLQSRRWSLPGLNVQQIKGEIGNLLSPHGRVVAEEVTSLVVVYEVESFMARISEYMDELQRQANILLEEEERLGDDPLVVREYRFIRDVADTDLITSLREAVSDDGQVIRNVDRNSLIVWERRSEIGRIDEVVKSLDMSPDQVLITSKLIEVTLDDYMGYGLQVFTDHSASNLNDGRFTGSSQNTSQGNVGGLFGAPTGFDPFFATFTNPRVDVRLELLANEGRVETLSQPTQMVSNRKTAQIQVGQEVPFLESSGVAAGTATASVSFKEVSIAMEITPIILEGGLIRLQISVAVREIIGNIAIEGNNTPILSLRESETDVFINDGETMIMGGLIRERERNQEQGLPFLKDIPFLGYLFKSQNRTRDKTDLLFFLRPQIVTAGMHAQISSEGLEVERDLRPLVYEAEDERKATIRPNRFRKLGIADRPRHYNPQNRPETADDVDPGA
jgi:type II secretory pathway component GspD/PulD (secretin)